MERMHFKHTIEYRFGQSLVETARSFVAVELLLLAVFRMAGSEFRSWVIGRQQFWSIQWLLVFAVLLLGVVVPAFGKWRTSANLGFLIALAAWTFFYGKKHFAELSPGFIRMANGYLRAWNDYYHTNYIGWDVRGENIGESLAFAVVVLVLLFLILRYLTGVRLFQLILPSAVFALGLLVDQLPDWRSFSYLLAGTLVLYSGGRSSAHVVFRSVKKGRDEQRSELWMQFVNLLQVIVLAGAVVFVTGALFADTAAKIPDRTSEFLAFQKNLETQIKNLGNLHLASDRAYLDNKTPVFRNELVLEISAASQPQSNLYLPEFYSGTYQNGSWVQDTKTYRKAASADGFDGDRLGMLLRQSVVEHLRENVKQDNFAEMADYTITYHANTSRAMLPYFSDVSSAGNNVWVTDEGMVKKKRFVDEVSFSGLTRNVLLGEMYERMDYYLRREENDVDRWYSDYVKEHYINGADLPAVKEFAADTFSELAKDAAWWDPLVSAKYDKERDAFSIQKTAAGEYVEGSLYSVWGICAFYAEGLIDQLVAGNLYYRGEDAYNTNNYRLAMAYAVRKQLAKRAKYNLYLDQIPNQTDTIEYFLETGHEGYCMHFASAGALTLQEMGIPARYASGYVVKRDAFEFDRKTGECNADVYDRNAHAWVEIYLERIGWVPFEMTPGYTSDNTGLPTDADKQQQLREDHNNKETPPADSESQADSQEETESQTEADTQVDTEKDTQSTQTPADGVSSPPDGSVNWSKILKIAGIVAAVVLLLVLTAFAAGRAMRHYRELLWQELNRKQYRRAVRRINRRIYRRLQKGGIMPLGGIRIRRSPGATHGVQWTGITDAQYEQRLVKAFPSIAPEDWKYYMDIMKKAAFSREEISREEAAHCYRIYRKHREHTKHT